MAYPVYTELFLRESGLLGPVYIDIPPDKRYVVRQVDVYQSQALLTGMTCRVKDTGTNVTVIYFHWDVEEIGGSKQWSGRQVFDYQSGGTPGNTIQVVSDAPIDISITGYAFTLPTS